MKIKDQIPSDNIDDNPSGWRQGVNVLLSPRQAYKTEPPDAVQATGQHAPKYDKMSREDMQRPAHGKKSNLNGKRNRELPKGLSGGW